MMRLLLALTLLTPRAALAADLYHHDGWSALASDRVARNVGDSLTVEISESSTAINSAESRSARTTSLGGQLSYGTNFDKSANLGLNGGSGDNGTTQRSGGMIAEISVTVDGILPNGDLHITGSQFLNVNGEKTKIAVAGRVRPADISSANTVQSSRIADAAVDYNGEGFVTRSSAPGFLTRVFNWLGLP